MVTAPLGIIPLDIIFTSSYPELVSGKLAKEIRQTKPFRSREEEAFLNLARTYEFLAQRLGELLKQYRLTPAQYNMLRILRGAGAAGVTCSQATERMLTPDPDITRLLDRMEAQDLIRRERSKEDRRVVITRITARGLELVGRIDEPLDCLFHRIVGRVSKPKLRELIDTLEALREPDF
jgi:DNA-binding MarR family transcriptional regulator